MGHSWVVSPNRALDLVRQSALFLAGRLFLVIDEDYLLDQGTPNLGTRQ